MKKLVMIITCVMAFSMLMTPKVMAGPFQTGDYIQAGDYVKLIAWNGLDSAGIMTYQVSHAATNWDNSVAFTYDTFCIQDNVYVYPYNWYPVADLSGTVGKYNVTLAGAGPLKGIVDYLFYRYKSGTGAYDLSSPSNQADFQMLLWNLQGTSTTGPDYNNLTGMPWDIDAANYINSISLHKSWGTKVINIAASSSGGPDIQNQLYNPDPPSVPEPTTMLLLGLGLAGLAGLRRKFQN